MVKAKIAVHFLIILWTTHGFVAPRISSLTVNQQGNHVALSTTTTLSMTATALLGNNVVPKNSTHSGTPVVMDLSQDYDEPPTLGQVRKLLPADVFQVDTATSLFYFAVDFIAVAGTMGFLNQVVTSDIYHGLAWWNQALLVVPLQVLTGFAMWCMWCIGMSRLVNKMIHAMCNKD